MQVELRECRADVQELRELIGDRTKPDSVRGRLHQMEGLLRSVVMKRAPGALLRRWERLLIVATAVAAAAAPYVLYFATRR